MNRTVRLYSQSTKPPRGYPFEPTNHIDLGYATAAVYSLLRSYKDDADAAVRSAELKSAQARTEFIAAINDPAAMRAIVAKAEEKLFNDTVKYWQDQGKPMNAQSIERMRSNMLNGPRR